jgi:hypothetical protein
MVEIILIWRENIRRFCYEKHDSLLDLSREIGIDRDTVDRLYDAVYYNTIFY